MNLTGDAAGLAVLKSFQEGNRDYLKFLIQEAKSVFEHHADFKGPDGAQYRLVCDVKTGGGRGGQKTERSRPPPPATPPPPRHGRPAPPQPPAWRPTARTPTVHP